MLKADKIDKNSEEYKNLQNLFPKLFATVQKLNKNRGELDFDDSAGQDYVDGISFNSGKGGSKDGKDNIEKEPFAGNGPFAY